MSRKMIVVDVARCVGCESCRIACAVAHSKSKDLAGALAEHPRPKPRVQVEAVGRAAVPMQCRHCEDAPCIVVCPSGALSRSGDDEPVLVDAARCIGCKMCVQVCPFGSITLSPEGRGVLKCDLCVERLRAGQKPACVTACPTRALRFEEAQAVSAERRREAAAQLAAEQR